MRDIVTHSSTRRPKLKRRNNWAALFSCDLNDPVVDEWQRIQDELSKWAHLRGPADSSDNPARVEELHKECEELLWKHMGSYTDVAAELDKILGVIAPSAIQVSYVRGFFSSSVRRRYFFGELNHAGWLQPLREAGFFKKHSPDQDRDGIMRPVYWPESGYLARMAEKEPSLVCDILLDDVPATANPYIYLDLLDAAVVMPPHESVRLQKKLCNKALLWTPYGVGENILRLIAAWNDAGCHDEASKLAWFLFDVMPGSSESDKTAELPHPVIRMEPHDYEEALNKYVKLHGDAPPIGLAKFLIVLLRRALEYSGKKSPEDYSSIWRPSIPYRENDFGRDLPLHILISALRDTVVRYAQTCLDDGFLLLIEKLESQPWHIFERLSLYVMAQAPDRCMNLIAPRLLAIGRYDNTHFRYEYFDLVRNGFPRLGPDDRKAFLDLIEQGPQDDRGLESRKRYWQMKRLSLIKAHLSADWTKRYNDLVAEFGAPAEKIEPEFTFRGGAYGDISPFAKSEIFAMSGDALLAALTTTEFSEKWDAPSATGLPNVLEECAKERPEPFAAMAHQFVEIRPSFISALIRGLKAARAAERDYALPNLLSLFETLAPPKPPSRHDAGENAVEWMKKEMASFLGAILSSKTLSCPPEYGDAIWRILVMLFKSAPPDALLAGMEKDKIDVSDAVMNASGTARGEAARAVMSYTRWRARQLGWDKIETARIHSMKDIPEVAGLLEDYLAGEFGADVHPSIGSNLRLLLWIDEDWVRRYLPRIFPEDSSHRVFRELAWCGYLNEQSVTISAVRAFEHQYRRAIAEMRDVEEGGEFPLKDTTCASHVINYYLSDSITLDDRGSLLALLLERAPARLMGEVFEDFRRSLDDESPDAEIMARLQALIEYRLRAPGASESGAAIPEIKGLAALICGKGFAADWAAANLLIALTKIDGKLGRAHWVARRMKDMAEEGQISEVLQGFILLTKGAGNDRDIGSWEDELHAVFEVATASSDPAILDLAKRLADALGDRGFDQYRKRWVRN